MNPRIPQIIADLSAFDAQLKGTKQHEHVAQILGSIKLYAAQLYLETDMEIISHNAASTAAINQEQLAHTEQVQANNPVFTPELTDAKLTEDSTIFNESKQEVEAPIQQEPTILMETDSFVADETLDVIEEDLEISEFEENDLHISQQEPEQTESLTPVNSEQPTETHTPDLFSTNSITEEDEEEEDDDHEADEVYDNQTDESQTIRLKVNPDASNNSENSSGSNVHLEQRATEILAMFSFSRRFEFGNFLFGGDMKLFAVFITEMLAAGSADAREDVFDTWYQQRQWSRRDESANDLKRNLKKMM